jgi:hypothetical protein
MKDEKKGKERNKEKREIKEIKKNNPRKEQINQQNTPNENPFFLWKANTTSKAVSQMMKMKTMHDKIMSMM